MYSIGDISKRVGIKIPTLRYYEQAGLVPAPERSDGKQRRYSDRDLERLLFVKHTRQLGFPLKSIASLITLGENSETDCGKVHDLADSHLSAVQAKLKLLKSLERELKRIVRSCHSGQVEACTVIESLSKHEWCDSEHEV